MSLVVVCTGDGGGPSGTAHAGRGPKPPQAASVNEPGVVSTAEKAHTMRQVRAGKANAGEPLLKCRKRVDGIGTGAGILPRDESGGCLRSWPGGVRHEGGASPVQAPVRNVGCAGINRQD